MVEVSEREFVTVKTTLPKAPHLSNADRVAVRTERLLLRPFTEDDLDALHALRLQPEVMYWTIQGKPDADIEATRKNLELHLPPKDQERYNWAICLKETGEFIGIGGSLGALPELGWPVLGYMLAKQHWGKGYATEFLKGFLDMWWALPREEVELKVEKSSVRGEGEVKEEFLSAITVDVNEASNKVLRKTGFELVKAFQEEDLHKSIAEDGKITLYAWIVGKPSAKN